MPCIRPCFLDSYQMEVPSQFSHRAMLVNICSNLLRVFDRFKTVSCVILSTILYQFSAFVNSISLGRSSVNMNHDWPRGASKRSETAENEKDLQIDLDQ